MGKQDKIVWLLILQGWAMLWVVIGHAGPANSIEEFPPFAQVLWNFAYSFHMPLFIMISGFLFYLTRINSSKWSYWPMMKEKMIRFGIPFVVWTIFAMVLKSVFSSDVERPTTISFSEFFNAILYPYNGPMREFWFLGVIIWMFALFAIWKILLRNTISIVLTSLFLVAFYFNSPNTDFLALNHVSVHASYFWWGLLAAKGYYFYNNKQTEEAKGISHFGDDKFKVFLLIMVVGIITYIISIKYSCPYVPAIFGSLFSLGLCLVLYTFWPYIFSSFRNYTYQIYLLGLFGQEVVKMIRLKMNLPFEPMYLVSIFAGLYIPVLISIIVEKINWKPLKLCIGLK